ncbi:MAG: DNA primase [Acidimicrobiia bacterium]|nr:DNA primase [Acidimicrobiia bacterium]
MGILDEDIARVRETTDIVALIGEHVALKRSGGRFTGLCPFHGEKTASFSVNAALGFYYCFGCQESGDAITFVRKIEGLDFAEAVERLAAKAGVTLRYDSAGATQDRRKKERLTETVSAAVEYYHRLLLEDASGGHARGYLRSRGFDGDAARQFSLGWSPDGYDTLVRHLYTLKFSRDDIVAAGLAFVNRAQKAQDFFRARLLFPIFDRAGAPVGFGGRTLTDDGPKYKNTMDTPLYHKSRLLYGLNWAKAEIGARDEVVICEGYTDVMGFALAGIPNAVATCGTALADDHVQILKSFTRHVVLAYDADSAGQNAAEKWYQWEQRFDIEVKVAALPNGQDPGDVFKDDPAALVKAVEGASRFAQFKIDRVLATADMTTPEGKARAADQVVPVLREIPNELVREQYIQMVSGTLGIEHGWFKQAIARRGAPRPRGDDTGERRPPPVTVDRREEDALRWAIHQPELVVDWLESSLFVDPVAREAFEHLWSADELHEAIEGAEGPARSLLERLAVEEPIADDEPETVRARLVVNIVRPAAERLQEEFRRTGDERLSELTVLLDQLRNSAGAGWAGGEAAAMQLVRCIPSWTTS